MCKATQYQPQKLCSPKSSILKISANEDNSIIIYKYI